MNCTYHTDMETGRTIYAPRTVKKQHAGLAAYQARKQEQEAAALAPFTVEKDAYGWTVKNAAGIICTRCIKTKREAVAWIKEEKARATERPETISNENEKKEEANTMESAFTFTANTLTCNGKTFPAEYSVTPSGAVVVFATMNGTDEPARIRFNPDHEFYAAALAAAKNEQPAAVEQPAPVEMPEEQPAAAAETPEEHSEQPTARDPKQARGPVPEKTFIGTEINSTFFRIIFDEKTQRTRVLIPEKSDREKARAVVEKAGFYYSPVMDSWNKKLTFKAHRAAQALAAELEKVFAA